MIDLTSMVQALFLAPFVAFRGGRPGDGSTRQWPSLALQASAARTASGLVERREPVLELVEPEPPPSAGMIGPPPLTPAEAAQRFLTWMQWHGWVGEMRWGGPNRDGVWEYYLWHCSDEGLSPLPEHRFAEAFVELSPKRLIRDYSSGKLRRWTVYSIPAGPEATPAEAPAQLQMVLEPVADLGEARAKRTPNRAQRRAARSVQRRRAA